MKRATAVVVGVGAYDGLGATLCRLIASKGMHVLLAGRTEAKLRLVADEIVKNGGSAQYFVADATDEKQVIELFALAKEGGENHLAPSLVIFNASKFARTPFRQISAAQFEEFWRAGCFAGFLVGREAAKILSVNGGGTVIFSGASASLRGKEEYAHFASAKAGLRMIAQSMAREFGSLGIHVAHVVLDGGIKRQIESPDSRVNVRNRTNDDAMQFDAVAQIYWQIHQQPRAAWTQELDLRSSHEKF